MNKASQVTQFGDVWAIEPTWANAMLTRLEGLDVVEAARYQAEFEAKQKIEESAKPKPFDFIGSTGIVRLSGPLTKRPTSASFLTGGTSIIRAMRQFDLALQDPDITKILLHVESPGGAVNGLPEFAEMIRTSKKPVTAFIEDMGCSAAYWLASQASEVYANAIAMVGNIGVYTAIEDSSAAATMAGVKVRLVKSGELKGMGMPGTEVTAAHIAELEDRVASLFGMFKDAVMAGRGIKAEDIDSVVAQGKAYSAVDALAAGLIDGVCSFDQCLSTISGLVPTRQPAVKPAKVQAKTSQRPAGEEKAMNWNKVTAFLRGSDPKALAEAGINIDDLESGANADQNVNTELAALRAAQVSQNALIQQMANATLNAKAEAFYTSLVTPNASGEAKAIPAQKPSIISGFVLAAKADGEGMVASFDVAGELVEGANLKAFKAGYENAQPHKLFATQLADENPKGETLVNAKMVDKLVSHLGPKERKAVKANMGGAN